MRIRIIAALLCSLSVLLGLCCAAASAAPAPVTPTVPAAIEPMAAYVGQVACDPYVKTGTAKLMSLLTHTYGGTSANSVYACGTDGNQSEHYDGRAIDWMVSIHNAPQYADAKAFATWLLATDSHGDTFAMARRLGVMYVIYNNKIWGSWNGAWAPYLNCASLPSSSYDSMCHRNHMHISLSWTGALGHTTFWGWSVNPTDYGPCRPADLNWAGRYVRNLLPCPDYKAVTALSTASALKKALVKYSGAAYQYGWTGPGVSALQQALHATVTGRFDTGTRAAVIAFQKSGGLAQTGTATPALWRALLPRVR